MNQTVNPLQQYFRRPALYVKLNSNGQWWSQGSLELPANQELPVYPMTAIDEITYRTPDALFNGQATVDVIQSCVPAIKDAWKMPMVDMNPVLVAIRIASNGHNINLESKCPACENVNDFELDLRQILENQSNPDFSSSVKSGDLEIFFRPMTYQAQNQINLAQFEQQRAMYSVNASELDDDAKQRELAEILKKITGITVQAIVYSIGAVRTPQAMVTEPEFITEFLANCDRNLFNQIKDHVIGLRADSELKPLQMKCVHCENDYQQDFSLDNTNFFATAS